MQILLMFCGNFEAVNIYSHWENQKYKMLQQSLYFQAFPSVFKIVWSSVIEITASQPSICMMLDDPLCKTSHNFWPT